MSFKFGACHHEADPELLPLYNGKSPNRYVAVPHPEIRLFKLVDPVEKTVRFTSGGRIQTNINGRKSYELPIHKKRPKFGVGFEVLSIKKESFTNGEPVLFRRAIVNSWKTVEGRKMYNLKYNDGTVEDMYEEFVIPPMDLWDTEKDVYCLPGKEPESDDESSDSSDSSESSESSESEKEAKKKHHKHHKRNKHHKHHKQHKKHSKRDQMPQVVVIPVFIPMSCYPSYY